MFVLSERRLWQHSKLDTPVHCSVVWLADCVFELVVIFCVATGRLGVCWRFVSPATGDIPQCRTC